MNIPHEEPQENDTELIVSSGNVFADLGLPNADEELAKAQLASVIRQRIESLHLTQTAAAKRLGTNQAKVSQLYNGNVGTFSLDSLVQFVNALEMDVAIRNRPPITSAAKPLSRLTRSVFSIAPSITAWHGLF